ncbi:regulator of chromosome condensation (RCC1) repeat domain containing protein [Acanthamoeba castellanii str. Neff]|uniref:Regulator of chromosome condensation (RCC1) repeat domain containing protein n=1 Tax=Acanthamoeba castellanii (strain ATCC 30010 / Neff) TaxID=1257118 RepID=L8H8I1_ACACF|nr:regulator of chromosome condensation (RCC1) repeat domain containing protein [Acanthamoeba castellanii str. Neff]ELR21814.1 regulator of chromosome condensation (RCC1) repeat domain containing protein [Acanthamoeba castellanii str. Neff]
MPPAGVSLGNLAYGLNTSSLPLTVDAGDLHFAKITPASNPFTCALSDADSFESLGEGAATAGQDYPIDPNRKASMEIFTDLCSGLWTSCGVLSNDEQGALGCGLAYANLTSTATPRLVSNLTNASAIFCGGLFNCALLKSGSAYCWGAGNVGQLGNGGSGAVSSISPVRVTTSNRSIISFSAGDNHACLIYSGNELICWGSNSGGKLGINNATLPFSVQLQTVAGHYKQVSCGSDSTCAIGTDDKVYCWGNSAILGLSSPQAAPMLIDGLPSSIQSVTMSQDVACAQTTALYGELGRGNVSSVYQSPAAIPWNGRGGTLGPFYAPFVKPVFDDVVPQVKLLPVDQEGVVGKPDDGALFSFVSVEEVSINGVVERSFSLVQALWVADNFVPVGGGDAITAVGYKSELSNNVTVRYSFFSYNRSLDVAVGDNFTLPMTPSFLKFSLVITTWPWLAPNNSLRVTLKVTPAFTSERTVVNYPKDDMTSLLLSSAGSASSVLVRVINFGLAGSDGRERVGVETHANVTSSSLIFAINNFADDLAYDPDLSVLVGRREESGGGGTDLALIVAVSVAVPLAVLFVVAVIVASLIIIRYRQQRRQRSIAGLVNYDVDNGSDAL